MIEKLIWMKGMTLSTLARGEKFDILDVDEKAIHFRLHSNGREYRITKKDLESARKELRTNGVLSLQQIFATGVRNSAYIAAVLASTIGVSYKTNPVRLYYRNPDDE